MKRNYTLLLFLLATVSILAQTPEKMSYQAVLRDTFNVLLTNQEVGMQISILQTTITGTAVYVETQTATTNINGLLSLAIGTGTSSDDFSAIDWSAGPYFIKTATDPSGGSSYSITGTSQLMSVPFAMYAKTSGSATPGPQGETGAAGADGSNGSNGAKGDTGDQGAPGIQGETGTAGADGVNGAKGDTGDQGAQGIQGTQGIRGETGAQGTQGETGAAGTNATQPAYTINTFYPELGGYVIAVRDGGKRGLVVAMQDQGVSNWFEANDANNHDVNGAKFMDWRLPNKRELDLMHDIYVEGNEVNLNDNFYWSSTAFDADTAWIQSFFAVNQVNSGKFWTYTVRAVRAF
jgi:hypothetical protein